MGFGGGAWAEGGVALGEGVGGRVEADRNMSCHGGEEEVGFAVVSE